MLSFGLLWLALLIFLFFVAPIWIVAHYLTQWRTAKGLSGEDQRLLADLWEGSQRMEARLEALERILDAQSVDWRQER